MLECNAPRCQDTILEKISYVLLRFEKGGTTDETGGLTWSLCGHGFSRLGDGGHYSLLPSIHWLTDLSLLVPK
jgi:hypothetical protein